MPSRLLLSVCLLSVGLAGQGTLKVHHINVDQGSATLIQGPTGQNVLIDAGNPGDGTAIIVPFLIGLGVTQLQAIILTHYHSDHWGGIPEVAAVFPPQLVYDRGTQAITTNLSSYLAAIASAGAQRVTLTPGAVLSLGGGASITCVAANGSVLGGPQVAVAGSSQEENARSLAMRLAFGNYQEAISGDLTGGGSGTANVETPAGPIMGDVDVLVANHHGSVTSTNTAWIAALRPEVSVCSCGANNPYGHPAQSAVNAILGGPTYAAFYRLNQGSSVPGGVTVNGHLRIETNGSTYQISGGSVLPWTRTVDEGPAPSTVLPGDVVVSEWLADPAMVADSAGEWVELANTTAAPVALGGFHLRDLGIDDIVLPAISIPARGRVVLARNGVLAQNGGVTATWAWPATGFQLSNSADEIELRDAAGRILDAVSFGGSTGIPIIAGRSTERRDLTADAAATNFAPAAAPFGAGDFGTPGSANGADATGPWTTLTASGTAQPGTTLLLALNGGFVQAGRPFILGCSDCAEPGLYLPGSGRTIDLCPTDLLAFSLAPGNGVFNGFAGTLNALGFASANVAIPNFPQLHGLTLWFSGAVYGPTAPETVGSIVDRLRVVIP